MYNEELILKTNGFYSTFKKTVEIEPSLPPATCCNFHTSYVHHLFPRPLKDIMCFSPENDVNMNTLIFTFCRKVLFMYLSCELLMYYQYGIQLSFLTMNHFSVVNLLSVNHKLSLLPGLK